jgi:hypothetical protein
MKTREGYFPEENRNSSLRETLPELGKLQLEVYNEIRSAGTCTTEEIAVKLGRYIHSITARVFELRDMEFVEFAGSVVSEKSNRKVSLWRVTERQLKLF